MEPKNTFVTHLPCPKCGSRDNNALYADGHEHCFSMGCDHHTGPQAEYVPPAVPSKRRFNALPFDTTRASRGISEATMRRYRVHLQEVTLKNCGRVECYVFDYFHEGRLVAQKLRPVHDKSNTRTWKFAEIDFGTLTYGQHINPDAKYVVVTEGEFDAAAAYQMLNGSKSHLFACVSVPTGSKGARKWAQASADYLASFERVVLCFDNDDSGRQGADAVLKLLHRDDRLKDKLYTMTPPAKDANEALQLTLGSEFLKAALDPIKYEVIRETKSEQTILATHPIGEFTNDHTGVAYRVLRDRGNDMLYLLEGASDGDGGLWFTWDGRRWLAHSGHVIKDWINSAVEELSREADALADEHGEQSDIALAARRWVRSMRQAGSSSKVLSRLSEFPSLQVSRMSEFDSNHALMSCLNGTVDLRTGELRPHRREDRITHCANANYRHGAPDATWMKYLRTTFADPQGKPRDEVIEFMQRFLGYAITGYIKEETALWLEGEGSNGKSTLLEVMRSVLGECQGTIELDILTSKKGDVRKLEQKGKARGKRIVTASESSNTATLNSALYKSIVSRDIQQGAFLKKAQYDFMPTATFVFAVNHLPNVTDASHGMWRRTHVVRFEQKFEYEKRDKDMEQRLAAEADGVFSWLVRGAVRYFELDNTTGEGLQRPKIIDEWSMAWKDDNDTLSQFLDEYVATDSGRDVPLDELFREYCQWQRDRNEPLTSMNLFSRRLKERKFTVERKYTPQGRKVVLCGHRFKRNLEKVYGFEVVSGGKHDAAE